MKKCKLCKKRYKEVDHQRYIESGICPDCWNKSFEITSICREDLPNDIDVSKITDNDMNYIADKMSDGFCDSYWENLDTALDLLRERIRS